MPTLPSITQGQMALDPVNQIIYYKTESNELKAVTLKWLQESSNEIDTTDSVAIAGNFVITGNLTVNGTTTTLNTENILVEDNILVLNSNVTGTPITNAGLEIERGDSPNVVIRWNETSDRWEFTDQDPSTGPWYALVKTTDDLVEGTVNKYFTNERAQDTINDALVAGTGIVKNYNDGFNTITISIAQPVGPSDNVTFNQVTADLVGDVTGTVSDISNHVLDDLSDVSLSSPVNGDFLRYQNNVWVNDAVNLATDTVGDYVGTIQAGTGILVTNTGGEGATPTISLNASIDQLTDFEITSAANGQTLIYNGTNWVNTTFPSTEPIGHENKADSVISFDESNRQFSIAPASTSYTVWCVGKRYVKTGTETVTIPDTSGLYYIYFNSSGSLAYKTTFFTWDQDTPTAYVYWNDVDNKAYFFADERHGVTLDWQTHEYLHRTRGAAIANGFGANNYSIVGDGSSDSHAKIDIADGTFFDEDLQVDITHSSSPVANTWQQRLQSGAYIPVFYRVNGAWKKDIATQFPIKNGGTRGQYNLNSAGTWSSTALDNSKYGVMFIAATNNLNEPVLAIMGQAQYTDQGSAEASTWDQLDLAGFPIVEFRPLYKIVFQTATAYTNTVKSKFVNVLDLRQMISTGAGGSAVAISDHGNMTGLADDDHTQYFNDARHDAHDHSSALNSAMLNDLGDVTISSPSSNQGLIWNGSAWVNQTIPLDINGLSDVIITSATPNQVLKFDGTNWVNDEPTSSLAGTTYLRTIGDSSNSSFVLNHSLSTRDIVVSFTEAVSPYASFSTLWEATDLNNITVYFENPPASNSVRVSIYAAVSGVVSGGGNVNSYATTIGDTSNLSYVITHNLGSRDIILQARNVNSPYEYYNVAWEATTINTATVYFDSAPGTNSIRIKIVS